MLVGPGGISELQLTDYDMMVRLAHRFGVRQIQIDPFENMCIGKPNDIACWPPQVLRNLRQSGKVDFGPEPFKVCHDVDACVQSCAESSFSFVVWLCGTIASCVFPMLRLV